MGQPSAQRRVIARDDLHRAVDGGLLDADQAERLWQTLDAKADAAVTSRFDAAHLLWYAGALVIITAMGWFTTLAFSQWGSGALASTAAVYCVGFTALGIVLRRRGLDTPGGLCVVVAVSLVPLFVYGLLDVLGWRATDQPDGYRGLYYWIKASWVPLEVATIVAGVIAIRVFRFPFLVAPVAVALWFMSMDLTPLLFGEGEAGAAHRETVSIVFGLAMLAVAWWVDVRASHGDAFWLHLFGLLAFWCALTLVATDSEVAFALYALTNVGLLALAVFLQRRAYAVFGGLGVAVYLAHLAGDVFADSLLYPFAMSLIGLLIVGAGIVYHRRQDAMQHALLDLVPTRLHALRPRHDG